MCGIAGIAAFTPRIKPTPETLRSMCDTIQYRGPDDYGWTIEGPVAMGMRRLAIIDVAGGQQPIYNEDRSVGAIFNGEIYNFRELRQQLEASGHRFETDSDTEVIPHLWEEYGAGFAEHLNGMFAIALHDTRRRRFVLARDHVGIKPLFYDLDAQRLVFGSEIKALLASGLVEKDLDVDALGEYMAWEYTPGPRTLLKRIRKLPPGHLLEVDLDSGQGREARYWDIPLDDDPSSSGPLTDVDWIERVDETIRQAVQRQLVSDVPLGAFLSGGVDSSIVVAGMGPARTFSVGFDDPTYNELDWAQRVAKHLGVSHDYEIIAPRASEMFDHLMNHLDDPIGDFSIFPTYMVSQHARQHVTVALSGDGGDELFGGYETFVAQGRARQWGRLPKVLRSGMIEPIINAVPPSAKKKGLVNKAKRFVEGLDHSDELLHTRWRLFVGEAQRQRLFTAGALDAMPTEVGAHITDSLARAAHRGEIDRMLYADMKSYLVDNCLVKVDRMSMANSLEARVPLLDKEVVELAFRLPDRLKIAGGHTKVLLKEVAARHVPRECVYRPKEGFSIPIKHWLKTELKPLMDALLAPSNLAADGLFNVAEVERLKTEHLADRANHSHALWAMMVFQDWRRRWQV